MVRRTEINDLNTASVLDVEKDILRLEVPMRDILAMTIGNSLQDLLADMRRLVLCQVLTLADFIEELAPVAQLGDQEYSTAILVDLVQSNNVGMRQVLENIDFVKKARLF